MSAHVRSRAAGVREGGQRVLECSGAERETLSGIRSNPLSRNVNRFGRTFSSGRGHKNPPSRTRAFSHSLTLPAQKEKDEGTEEETEKAGMTVRKERKRREGKKEREAAGEEREEV